MKRTLYYTILICVTICCIGIGLTIHAIQWGSRIGHFTKREGTRTVSRDYTVTEAVDSVKMDLSFGDVEIESGDGFSAEWKGPAELAPEINNIHGALVITQDGSLFHSTSFTGTKKLTVTLPEGQVYSSFHADVDMGDFEIRDVAAKEADLNLSMGNLELKDSSFDTLKVSSSMGNVEIKDSSAKSGSFSADMGNIKIEDLAPFESLSVDASLGNVDLDLKMKEADLTVQVDSDLGSVTLNGRKLSDSTTGSGSAKLTANAGLGSVKIHTDD